MNMSDKIKRGRMSLGLSDVDVAAKAGLTIYEYGDLESYDDELETVLDLKRLKRLLAVLNIDIFDILSIRSMLDAASRSSFSNTPRNLIVKQSREQRGKTKEELSDDIGFYEHIVDAMESEEEFLESWCIEDIKKLSEILSIPVPLLLFSPNERRNLLSGS